MSDSNEHRARAIAFYLPQYHPVPENDAFWGKGFTEWTNVTRAKPLFRGHMQPNLPRDLGFYDLRVPEVREMQANLARNAGIEGFCYWHYWFGNGVRVLERIFNEVVNTGKPDFPFCLGWANESWTGRWHGLDSEVIFKQGYYGVADHEQHFHALLPAFLDNRYIEVESRKLFLIYRPEQIPNLREFLSLWNRLAIDNGFNGFHFVSVNTNFDHHVFPDIKGAIPSHISSFLNNHVVLNRIERAANLLWRAERSISRFLKVASVRPLVAPYKAFAEAWAAQPLSEGIYPCAIPNWDNTPRCGARGLVLADATPELFGLMVARMLEAISDRPYSHRLLFIKSWNEWAEGNYLEPDQRNGMGYLDQLRRLLLPAGK